MKRIRCDKIVTPDGLFDGFIYHENGRIAQISARELSCDAEYNATGCTVTPGFIDIHTHGGGGFPFEGEVEDIVSGTLFHLRHGTTTVCPTVSAAPLVDMARSVANIAVAMKDERTCGVIHGAHLEGPYLSPKQAGAQCPDFITPPDEKEYLPLLEQHADAIARWSYAPENDDGSFAKALVAHGVIPAAGHTDAIGEDMARAEAAGCHLVTHLYSCTSTVTRDHGFRRLGVIEHAYLSDTMDVEIICDGKHLPPDLIRLIYKIKGWEHIALITDSLSLAGTSQTEGRTQATEFIIEDGVCKLKDRSAFAGSIATADRLLRVAVQEAGLPLVEAVKMMTETPARIMGLTSFGVLAPQKAADFVVLDANLQVKQVFKSGIAI